jgi:hypothetical protein
MDAQRLFKSYLTRNMRALLQTCNFCGLGGVRHQLTQRLIEDFYPFLRVLQYLSCTRLSG